MTISASDVKKLRDATGVGMMDAKKALGESGGDLVKATELLRKAGQKMAAKKADREAAEGVVGFYMHANNRVAALVTVNCETDFVARTDEFKEFANNLAMQVVAMSPEYLNPEDVPAEIVEKEKEIYREEMKDSGKPADVMEKIIAGKLDKFYSEVCLIRQPFIKDDSLTIEKYLTDTIGKIGENIKIQKFVRYSI